VVLLLHHVLLHLHLHRVAHVSWHVVVAAVMHRTWATATAAHHHHVLFVGEVVGLTASTAVHHSGIHLMRCCVE
jgi:hypothetical protein